MHVEWFTYIRSDTIDSFHRRLFLGEAGGPWKLRDKFILLEYMLLVAPGQAADIVVVLFNEAFRPIATPGRSIRESLVSS